MPKTLKKPGLHCTKLNLRLNPELNNITSSLPTDLQSFNQKLSSGNGFLVFNELFRLWIIR